MSWAQQLLRTVALRPYVFLFLTAFLVLAVAAWGWRRTLVFLVLASGLGWLAEFSSLRTGFPFGDYDYFDVATRERETWIGGVPLMSSLSFVFLTFAGLQTARVFLQRLTAGGRGAWDVRWSDAAGVGTCWSRLLSGAALGGLLTTGLDLIIDPASLRGSRWFLGDLYRYPGGGFYFGVPLSNFIGWLLLSVVILSGFLSLDRILLRRAWGPWRGHAGDAAASLGLFTGIIVFNLAVTWTIGEAVLGVLGCLWAAVMLLPVAGRLRTSFRRSERATGEGET